MQIRSPINPDRKSTRLNSSHRCISYAVFCLKKKDKTKTIRRRLPLYDLTQSARRRLTPRRVQRCRERHGVIRGRRAHIGASCLFFFLKDRAPTEFTPFPPPRAFQL